MSSRGKETAGSTGSAAADPAAEERKRKRQERNRESARESRKRKRDKTDTLRSQLARLEAENLQLRLQLKESSEGGDAAPKARSKNITDSASVLEGMVANGSSDAEITAALQQIQEQYADYGANHKSAVGFHISQLRQCLLPTQITQTVLWMNKCANYFQSQGGVGDPCLASSVPPEAEEAQKLFKELAEAMHLSPEQKQEMYSVTFFARMEDVASRCSGLIDRLEELVSSKNESLDSEMRLLQQSLNPSQVAKFVVWTHKNPAGRACVQMLDSIWPKLQSSSETRIGRASASAYLEALQISRGREEPAEFNASASASSASSVSSSLPDGGVKQKTESA